MLICQYCGHQEMNDSENFCNRCGAPFRKTENRIAVSGGDKMVVHGGEKLAVSTGDQLAPSQSGTVANVQPSAAPAVKQQSTGTLANQAAKTAPAAKAPAAKTARRGMATTGMVFSIVGLALIMLFSSAASTALGDCDEDALAGITFISSIPAILATLGVIFSAVTIGRNPSKGKNIAGLICGVIALMAYMLMMGSCIGFIC